MGTSHPFYTKYFVLSYCIGVVFTLPFQRIYNLPKLICWCIKWKHFPRYSPFVKGIHRSQVDSPHKGQSRGALMFSLIYVWTNGPANNRDVGGFETPSRSSWRRHDVRRSPKRLNQTPALDRCLRNPITDTWDNVHGKYNVRCSPVL